MSQPTTSLKEGEKGKISHFLDDLTGSKLLSMGVLPGSQLEVVRIAPFGGGIYLRVDGINLALRKEEAMSIIVEQIEVSKSL